MYCCQNESGMHVASLHNMVQWLWLSPGFHITLKVFQDLEWSHLFLKDSMKYFVHYQDDLQKRKGWYFSWGLQWVHPNKTPFPDLGHKKISTTKNKTTNNNNKKQQKKRVLFPTTDKIKVERLGFMSVSLVVLKILTTEWASPMLPEPTHLQGREGRLSL